MNSILPLIIGFGGINPAGRSSYHRGYQRTVLNSLPLSEQKKTVLSLASMMNLIQWKDGKWVDNNGDSFDVEKNWSKLEPIVSNETLIRKIHPNRFDSTQLPMNRAISLTLAEKNKPIEIQFQNTQLTKEKRITWDSKELEQENAYHFSTPKDAKLFVQETYNFPVQVAGQIPTGFNPSQLYPSKSHPHGICYSIYGISDAIHSLGIDWEDLTRNIPTDRIGVYASSSMGQLDEFSAWGFLRAANLGKKPNSKQLPFAFPEMTADFINSYVIGNAGHTLGAVGACATLLYNLYSASEDIRNGKRDIAIVGASEAPVTPEVMAGYHAMTALADDKGLASLDNVSIDQIDYRKACRPFSDNCGFVMSESAQFFILASENLALKHGCQIFGSVGGIHIAADGFKHSISKPGLGNYLTFFKCMGLAEAILGTESLQQKTFIQAHGTGTPQNRVSESMIFSKAAQIYGMNNWKVSAIKSYLGHPLGPAGGDQIASVLGTWKHGWIPGIKTISHIASNVHQDGLKFLLKDEEIDTADSKAAFVNAKGFGGNNATALILSPSATEDILQKKHGKQAFSSYQNQQSKTFAKAEEQEMKINQGDLKPIYQTTKEFQEYESIQADKKSIQIPEKNILVSTQSQNPFL